MTRQRNLLPLAGLVVCVLAFLSYFLFFYQFPVTRDIPWVNWLLFAVGLALVGIGVARPFRSPERYRGRYGGKILGPVGEKAPDFTLPDIQGRPVRLSSLLEQQTGSAPGSWVLLIFYRGYW